MTKYISILPSIYNFENYNFAIDNIHKYIKNKDEVTVVFCGRGLNYCAENPLGFKKLCFRCSKITSTILKNINIEILSFNDLGLNIKTGKTVFEFDSLESLKAIIYKDAEIGLAVISQYVSMTRNLNPFFNHSLTKYLNKLLYHASLYTEIAYQIIKLKPDVVILVNGRMFDSRPFVNICEKKGVNYICEESAYNISGHLVKENFYCSLPHDISSYTRKIHNMWNGSNVPLEERIKIGNSFFVKRSLSQFSGDKVYTIGQDNTLIPADWDNTKTNITIFNSSEDELFSIGREYEINKLFNNQIDGINYILKKYKNNNELYFYLRIHPNLKNIKYKYHTDLLKLEHEHENITVIKGDSPTSSYSLLNNSDKVIVFGSTMGVEAGFWGKQVLLLSPANYQELSVCYKPKSLRDIEDFLDNKINFIPSKINAIKYGYHALNDERGTNENLDTEVHLKLYKVNLIFKKFKFNIMDFGYSNIGVRILLFEYLTSQVLRKIFVPRNEK